MSAAVEYSVTPGLGYCAVVPDFLTPRECRELIALAENKGFRSPSADYPPTYRNNDRLVHDDESLAKHLFERLHAVAPPSMPAPDDVGPGSWRLDSVNERLRFCRYTADQQFRIHQDGVHHRAFNRRSMLTFIVYLSDGEDFVGGDTEFFADGPRATPDGSDQPEVVVRVRPKMGTLILFEHRIWHAGAKIVSGTKYILRSDVLYRNDEASSLETSGHRGYIWTLSRQGPDSFVSGGRDCSIRVWNRAFEPTAVLTGHTHSVLGLAPLDVSCLASVSRDRTLRIWNVSTSSCTNTVVAHDAAALTVVRLDGERIATGGADRVIRIWSHAGSEIAGIQAHDGWVWKLVRVNDRLFASASEDGAVKLWQTKTHVNAGCLPGTAPLRSMAASPDGKRLVTGDVLGRLRVWVDLETNPQIESEWIAHRAAVRSVVFLGPNTIASGGEDNRMHVWSGGPRRLLYRAEHKNFVTDIIAVDGQSCASTSYGGEICVHRYLDPLRDEFAATRSFQNCM